MTLVSSGSQVQIIPLLGKPGSPQFLRMLFGETETSFVVYLCSRKERTDGPRKTMELDQSPCITGPESMPDFSLGLLAGGAIHRLDLMF
jgi:hypothetical protein